MKYLLQLCFISLEKNASETITSTNHHDEKLAEIPWGIAFTCEAQKPGKRFLPCIGGESPLYFYPSRRVIVTLTVPQE